jgi:phosphoribosylamine---glycine ligase
MKILIIGSGGREHAMAWKISQEQPVNAIFVAPGNAGTHALPKTTNIPIQADDISQLADFAQAQHIDLTIVGPEAPLVDGIVDVFNSLNLACFGPTQSAAQLEGSKTFSKDFLARHNIPTAQYQNFSDLDDALTYLDTQSAPIVIKADGLAAGKGVIIAQTILEAKSAVTDMLSGNSFGDAGCKVVIEEFLDGEEASFITMVDGTYALPLATSQDHKRALDGDKGLNTGGMGAYSPAPVVTKALHKKIMEDIIYPTIQGMESEGNTFTGFLYAGLMITKDNIPKVIEFNCRLGDPETQPILMRLQSNLSELCLATVKQTLSSSTVKWDERPALGIVIASGGYPQEYTRGHTIHGLEQCHPDTVIFHAGTQIKDDTVVTQGGRVLCVTALGDSISSAQKTASKACESISFNGAFYRKDIGHRAISREQE